MLKDLEKELLNLRNDEKSKLLSRYFKTGKGQYGYGDYFLGITVPETRKIAIKFKNIGLDDAEKLLFNKYHEFRLAALLILVQKFKEANEKTRKEIVDFYLKNTKYINNWDLVDLSAHKILGQYLIDKDRSILYKLSKSKDIWERRISVISTFNFIKNNQFEDIINISEILLKDEHDLMHKAVGWGLREMGKKDNKQLINFLNKHYKKMPRTMLRYSIEKLPVQQRLFYLKN